MAERTRIRVGDIVNVHNWDGYSMGLVLSIAPGFGYEIVYFVALFKDCETKVIIQQFFQNGCMPSKDISNLEPVWHVDLSPIALMTGYYDQMRNERAKIYAERNDVARMMDEQISVLDDIIRGEEY